MLLSHLKVSGLLSFGPDGLDLPLKRLNVLIGPNGSGKSNLLEILALLKAAPTRFAAPIKAMGGIDEWLWKQPSEQSTPSGTAAATVEAGVAHVMSDGGSEGLMFVHHLRFGSHAGRFELFEEEIANPHAKPPDTEPWWYYRNRNGTALLNKRRPVVLHGETLRPGDETIREIPRHDLHPEESLLSQIKDPAFYEFLTYLQVHYSNIHLYRNWSFGPGAVFRQARPADERSDFLIEGGANLANVLSKMALRAKPDLLDSLRQLFDGIEDFHVVADAGTVQLFLLESGGRAIPATRLSDGTLRYLCLLAILLHPQPPPLVAIEEPELGLHPDLIPHLAELLVRASKRTQIIATTHSRMLVDALSDAPEAVVVCEKVEGQSRFERLDPGRLAVWLERYTLGKLWSMGDIGGNRW